MSPLRVGSTLNLGGFGMEHVLAGRIWQAPTTRNGSVRRVGILGRQNLPTSKSANVFNVNRDTSAQALLDLILWKTSDASAYVPRKSRHASAVLP